MISPALKLLLDTIRSKEAPKGYGQIYSGAKGVSLSTDVSRMTLNQVLNFQRVMLDAGSASSACGGYQFLRKTLQATIAAMGLTGKEVWTPELQDRMAVQLMEGRRLGDYMAGRISPESFANKLAMEWASLPVVTTIPGQKRTVHPGESYYAGDGLNKAHHDPAAILALVKALRKPQLVAPAADPPAPPAAPPKAEPPATARRWSLWAWIERMLGL
jgi:muramidase (phage lysozyme)